jgi:hypothetical protein
LPNHRHPVPTVAFRPFLNVSLKPSDKFIQVANELLPAVARTPLVRFPVHTLLISGAVLPPSLLHQDPRYFYQGTGTTKSRKLHALSSPFICKRDDGRSQPNDSSIGGDLASSAISNAYYPAANRSLGLVLQSTFVTTGARLADTLMKESILRKLTPNPKF